MAQNTHKNPSDLDRECYRCADHIVELVKDQNFKPQMVNVQKWIKKSYSFNDKLVAEVQCAVFEKKEHEFLEELKKSYFADLISGREIKEKVTERAKRVS